LFSSYEDFSVLVAGLCCLLTLETNGELGSVATRVVSPIRNAPIEIFRPCNRNSAFTTLKG
jgi:hypothetical protein